MVHYEDTIRKRVSLNRIADHIQKALYDSLHNIFGIRPIAVWGSRDTDANRSKFDRMKPGDEILIVEGKKIILLGKIAAKTVNRNLSGELWRGVRDTTSKRWSLIYFIANPAEINLPFRYFARLVGYDPNYQLRGFSIVSKDRTKRFFESFEDLYSVLLRLSRNQEPIQKEMIAEEDKGDEEWRRKAEEEVEEILQGPELSEHVKKQYQLLRIGLKAGIDVWIPKADQPRIREDFGITEFNQEFTTGIDVPVKYVENIDVVWKEEFRIHAAFEIEHSTAIYSGLLRFSDLKIIAPNSLYDLIIVAPEDRRARVRDQVERPTFKRVNFGSDVRFLPYESVDEVDALVEKDTEQITRETVLSKAEALVVN